MAKGEYIGVSGKAKKVKKMYVGIGGKAKKVKKAYIGVGGKAKLCWSGADGTFLITNFTSSRGSGRIGKIDRSSLTMTTINNASVGFKQIIYCQGRWFAIRDEYGSSTYTYLVYSNDGVTWTTSNVGSFNGGNLCADSEYVYLRTYYQGGSWIVRAIKATTLEVITILSSSYYSYGEPIITYDNKILFSSSYYNGSTTIYESKLVTRNGSSFSNQTLNIAMIGACVYGSSSEKTVFIGMNNSSHTPFVSYYKNGSITQTQVRWQGKAGQGSGIIYGKGVFTDGIHVSSDGITWSEATIGSLDLSLVGYGDGIFIKITAGTTDYYHVTVSYSEDCTNWTVLGEIDASIGTAFSNRCTSCSYDIAKGYGDK